MKICFKLNLKAIWDYVDANPTYQGISGLKFSDIEQLDQTFAQGYEDETFIDLDFGESIAELTTDHYALSDNIITDICDNGEFIIFKAEYNNVVLSNIDKLLTLGFIELNQNGYTSMILYRLNDTRNTVSKSLLKVGIMDGHFKAPIGLKNMVLDVSEYQLENIYNYVFIPKLNRYYYVNNIELTTKDYTRLQLQEDVLMSWDTLIRSQSAFLVRSENNSNNAVLFDNRLPLEDLSTVIDITSQIVDTPSLNSLVNIVFDFTNTTGGGSHSNILLTTFCKASYNSQVGSNEYHAPTGSGLPDLSSTHNNQEFFSFITPLNFAWFMKGYVDDDTTASFVLSALWLPFDPQNAFQLESQSFIRLGEKYVNALGAFVPNSASDQAMSSLRGNNAQGLNGLCPYLILKDFTFSDVDSMTDYEPYSNYEMYIPFVGWVKIELNKFVGSRILIYYTMDLVTGLSTAYIYNYSKKSLIWSGSCQLGIKIDLSTSNQLENIRQKQANETNMVLSLLTSALSIGVGVVSENPLAVVGGVMGGTKAVTSFVNANNQIFDRAQTTFGTGDGALHSNNEFKLRKTTHALLPIDYSVYGRTQGYPTNEYISDFTTITGYVEIGEIQFNANGEDIYNSEIDEIVTLLKNGVIM